MKLFKILTFIYLLTFLPFDRTLNTNICVIAEIIKIIILYLLLALLLFDTKNYTKENTYKLKDFIIISTLSIIQPVHFWAANVQNMHFSTGLFLCIVTYLYFGIMFLLSEIITKNKDISLFWAIILTLSTLNIFYNITTIFFISVLLLYVFSHIKLKEIKKPVIVFSLVLLILNVTLMLTNYSKMYISALERNKTNIAEQNTVRTSDRNRDIYIILLDQYSGTDILKKKYNFDNAEFINELKKEGFFVFDKMYSNYNTTLASVPTILNAELFDTKKYKTYSEAVNNAKIFQNAKKHGYHVIVKNSTSFNIKSQYIDYVIKENDILQRNELLLYFFKENLYRNFINAHIQKQTEKYRFDFEKFDNVKEKKLVFMHLLMPHPAFWLDEDGNPQKTEYLKDFDNGYLPWLKYTNKKALEYVHYLLANSQNKPVIIITGDHGMRDETIFDSFFSTFTAYYNPEQEYTHVKNSKTLVNVFAKIQNYEFSEAIPIPKDSVYYIEKYASIFDDDGIIWRVNSAKDVTKRYIK